jgi:hypothetical protein
MQLISYGRPQNATYRFARSYNKHGRIEVEHDRLLYYFSTMDGRQEINGMIIVTLNNLNYTQSPLLSSAPDYHYERVLLQCLHGFRTGKATNAQVTMDWTFKVLPYRRVRHLLYIQEQSRPFEPSCNSGNPTTTCTHIIDKFAQNMRV